jgi:energy-coupling factor transport system substrate-specific component
VEDELDRAAGPWDGVALELRRLRALAGAPSYAEIARRVEQRRASRGLPPAECRLARTTVYDVFRLGRARLDSALVHEVAAVLDDDPHAVRAQVRDALRRVSGEAGPPPSPAPAAGRPAEPPAAAEQPGAGWRRRSVLAVVVLCVTVNLLGRVLVDAMQVPLYLDMVGTAVCAVLLGPWRAVAVGLLTNVIGIQVSGAESLPFAVINVAGALVWGYGVWRWGAARSVSRFFALCVVVALTCSALAVPIILLLGGATGNGADAVVQVVLARTGHLWMAVTTSNLVTSLGDKLISGFLALLVLDAVATRGAPSDRVHDAVAQGQEQRPE